MNRYKELEEYIQEYCNNRKNEKRNSLANYKDGLLIQSLEEVLETLIQQEISYQEAEGQDEIKYLIFQRLLSSGYTGSYEISVGMSNAKLYLDEQIAYEYWKPDFIYDDIDEAMKEVRRILSKKYVQLEEYEMLHLKQQLLLDDWHLFVEILKKEANELARRIMESSLLLEDEIQIVYGNYMDQLRVAHKVKTFYEEEKNG